MRKRVLVAGVKYVLLALCAAPVAGALAGGLPASAGEAIGDLDLHVRLLGVDPEKGNGRDLHGAVRIEAELLVAQSTEGIRLSIEKPDGSPWMVGSHPLDLGRVKWTTADGGEPQEASDGTPSVGARQILRTQFTVPLKGVQVHEIIVRVTAAGPQGALSTEAMLKAPLGVPLELPEEQDGVATFKMKEVKP